MSRLTGSGVPALLRDYRCFAGRRLWLAFALMIVGALAEGFGLLMIVPLATVAMTSGASAPRFFFTFAEGWTAAQWFAAALALFVAAMAARALLLFARDLLLAQLQSEYEADLRSRAAATLAGRGWPFASRIGQEGMQALLLTDVPRAAQASAYLQNIALASALLLVQLAIAFLLSPTLSVIALVFMIIGGIFSARVAARGVRSGFAISDSMEDSAASGFRLHAGLKAALAQGTVAAFLGEYRFSLDRSVQHYARFARDYGSSRQSAGFAAALVAAILLAVGVQLLSLPFPVLVTSLILFARMNAPAQMLQNSVLQAAVLAPSFMAVERRLNGLELALPQPASKQQRQPWSQLALDNVSYRHATGRGLTGVSLTIRSGEWIGIEGASGAGKTTLVDLIAGLLAPESGIIAVDDAPLTGVTLDRWRAGLSYVGQDGTVFADSVRANLLADGEADDGALWQTLETVGLAERIRAFPRGLDEHVGDRGSQLSGGERQRLVLARAVLRRPLMLILDEATAALDAAGEAQLIDQLRTLQPRPAALVIAHREATLAHCDSRVAIQHGVLCPKDAAAFAVETTSAGVNVPDASRAHKE